MNNTSRLGRSFLLLSMAVCWLVCRAHATYTSDANPVPATEILSTNWLAAAKAALPAKYLRKELTFQQITNLLCQESDHGNNTAQGLWGFVLVVQSRSPEAANAGLALLRSSAEKGWVPAMLQLGSLFENGTYINKDYQEAFHWFGLAADHDNPEALLELGGCYHYGLGTTQNCSMAVTCYRRSAARTNYVAMKSLGFLLMNGIGVEQDAVAAKYWFTRAAKEGGNRRAMYNLGGLASRAFPDTNSNAEAFQWFKQSADLGDALACLELAHFYFNGWGVVTTNLDTYRFWLRKAATLGATDAQYRMGAAYRLGDGVPKDVESSVAWYRKAAAKNDPRALYDLALHYHEDKTNRAATMAADDFLLRAAQGGHREAQFLCAMSCFRGDVAPRDFEGGQRWLARSAENGWPRSEFCLYQLYYNGAAPAPQCPLYPKDRAAALKWLRRAAEHQHLQAEAVWAVTLIRGIDTEQNKPDAEKLLRHAAERGWPQAQNDLGFAIQNGDTRMMDFVEAAMWCRLAATQITDPGLRRRAEVNLSHVWTLLTVDQQQEVDRRVKTFRPLAVPDADPMAKGWEKKPGYEQEDGRFGH
jgi:uncharacterized protein